MDKRTYLVPKMNQRSQLLEEVILAIRKRHSFCEDGSKLENLFANVRLIIKMTMYVKQFLFDVTRHGWYPYVESLEVTPTTVWQAVSRLVGDKRTRHSLQSLNGDVNFADNKAEIFADFIQKQFLSTRPS